ncbi:hypothetical protein EWM64_g10439 [Hericium alpestre]|uniref:Uncharacterized protein n=1 Tax=Hericium alpestre TaxID=135208 RepID=A0A4Y9ZIB4_9AGAM|nr:hypothetical protein EWM64_g10439 [Hericium alpestre]
MSSFPGQATGLDGSVQASMENIWALTQRRAREDRRDVVAPTYSSQHIRHSGASQGSALQAEQAQAMMLRGDVHGQINASRPMDNTVNARLHLSQQLNNDYDPSLGISPQTSKLPLQFQPSVPVQSAYSVQPTLPVGQPVAQQLVPTQQPVHSQPQLFRYIAPSYNSSQVYTPAPQLYTQGDQPFPGLVSGGSSGPFAVGVVPVPSYLTPQKQLAGTRKKTGGPSRKQTARGTGDAELAAKNAAKKNAPAQYPGLVAAGQCMMGGECVHFKGTKCNWAEHFRAHDGCYDAANEMWVCRWSPGCGLPFTTGYS